MKKKIYSAVIVLSLAAPALVVAAESQTDVASAPVAATENPTEFHGAIELGAQAVHVHGNAASFQEFRDLDDSLLGKVQLDYSKNAYYFQFDADNPGRDDQSYQLKGGEYDNFKYKFYFDEMAHNYTFDAIAPFTGLGNQQIYVFGAPKLTRPDTWTTFDYAVEHKKYGGEVEVSLHSPFYVNIGVERREQSGLRPYSLSGTYEVPEPISNSTNNLSVKGGYLGKEVSMSLTGTVSSFNNDNNFFVVGTNSTSNDYVLAPDNTYRKLAADLTWRDLPVGSVLAAGVSYANLHNDFSASDIGYTAAMVTTQGVNRSTFEGDIDYTNASIALSSRPTDKLDTKIYYNYLQRVNNSSDIFYGVASAATNNAKELLSYDKNTTGIDLGYRLPSKTKLDAGYEYLNMDRSTALPAYISGTTFYRYDNPGSTTDETFYAGLKNSTLDWLTAKLKYTRLNRQSDINLTNAIVAVDPAYTTRFDTQSKTMNEWKLGFDLNPVERLDLGLEFKYQHNNYDQNISSRNDDMRQSVYADFTWRAASVLTLTGFVGYEKEEIDANKRVANLSLLDHVESTDDSFWSYGLGAKVLATDKLTFNFSGQFQKSDGAINFTQLAASTYQNITESDDYTKTTLEAKATYAINPNLGVTLGYMFERLRYSDVNYENYVYYNTAGGTFYYSGVYADPNYDANVTYVMVKYGF